jgi:hypothetical protein
LVPRGSLFRQAHGGREQTNGENADEYVTDDGQHGAITTVSSRIAGVQKTAGFIDATRRFARSFHVARDADRAELGRIRIRADVEGPTAGA